MRKFVNIILPWFLYLYPFSTELWWLPDTIHVGKLAQCLEHNRYSLSARHGDIDIVDNYAFLSRQVYKKLKLLGLQNTDLPLCFMIKQTMLLTDMKRRNFTPVFLSKERTVCWNFYVKLWWGCLQRNMDGGDDGHDDVMILKWLLSSSGPYLLLTLLCLSMLYLPN